MSCINARFHIMGVLTEGLARTAVHARLLSQPRAVHHTSVDTMSAQMRVRRITVLPLLVSSWRWVVASWIRHEYCMQTKKSLKGTKVPFVAVGVVMLSQQVLNREEVSHPSQPHLGYTSLALGRPSIVWGRSL